MGRGVAQDGADVVEQSSGRGGAQWAGRPVAADSKARPPEWSGRVRIERYDRTGGLLDDQRLARAVGAPQWARNR